MQIIEFDASRPDLIEAGFGMLNTAHNADIPEHPVPVRRMFETTFTAPWPGRARHWFAAIENGRIVGLAILTYWLDSNTTRSFFNITVAPDRRRDGIGTALLDTVVAHSREHGRHILGAMATLEFEHGPSRDEAGARFLEKHGFDLALTTVYRRSRVDALGSDQERRLYDQALAASGEDYELRQWVGPCPDDLIASLARMESTILNEVPLGDLEIEAEEADPAKLRAAEAVYKAEGRAKVDSVAVHRDSGEIVAWSDLNVDEGPYIAAHQGITIVDPAHRGHRLGMLVKLANLRLLRRTHPNIEEIWADNADINEHMIAINAALGYETVDAAGDYQRRLEN